MLPHAGHNNTGDEEWLFQKQKISENLHHQVCGSDGKTYENSCELENVSCRKYWDIKVVSMVSDDNDDDDNEDDDNDDHYNDDHHL